MGYDHDMKFIKQRGQKRQGRTGKKLHVSTGQDR